MVAIEAEGLAWQYNLSKQRGSCGNELPQLSRGFNNVCCQASPSASIATKGGSYTVSCKTMGGAVPGEAETSRIATFKKVS